VVPAAGVGKRMQANCPKQYLSINSRTILEHTVLCLASHPDISSIVIAVSEGDGYFADTKLAEHEKVTVVNGGKERVDSVLAGLNAIDSKNYPWALVHDAARPCVSLEDVQKLIDQCLKHNCGGILASPVKDTMKRGIACTGKGFIEKTIEREYLWHALTPQMFPTVEIKSAIQCALKHNAVVTDEASAIEFVGGESLLVEGSSDNIKITRPDDLALAEFILSRQEKLLVNNDSQEQLCE